MSQDPQSAVSRESDKFMLRFPVGMREHIAEAAARNKRSMNSEIIDRLEVSLSGLKAGAEGAVPESAITALAHRIALVETELLARKADLVFYAEIMGQLVSALPFQTTEDPILSRAISEAKKAAKQMRQTPGQKTAAAAAHREKFKQAVELLQQVQSVPELPEARDESSGAQAPLKRVRIRSKN